MAETQDLSQILHLLDKLAKSFVAICSRTISNCSVLKETFESLSLLLQTLEKEYVKTTRDPEILMSHNVSNILLDVLAMLLEGKLL